MQVLLYFDLTYFVSATSRETAVTFLVSHVAFWRSLRIISCSELVIRRVVAKLERSAGLEPGNALVALTFRSASADLKVGATFKPGRYHPPDLAKVDFLHSAHERRVALGASDFRGAPLLAATPYLAFGL